jgi:hypothetical protein
VLGRTTFVALTSVTNGVRECDCAGLGRGPRSRPDMIARDFAFRGRSAANELSEFRDHGPGRTTVGRSCRKTTAAKGRPVTSFGHALFLVTLPPGHPALLLVT